MTLILQFQRRRPYFDCVYETWKYLPTEWSHVVYMPALSALQRFMWSITLQPLCHSSCPLSKNLDLWMRPLKMTSSMQGHCCEGKQPSRTLKLLHWQADGGHAMRKIHLRENGWTHICFWYPKEGTESSMGSLVDSDQEAGMGLG